jgi:zinc protease
LGKEDKLEDARQTLLNTLDTFAKTPPSAADVQRIQAQNEQGFDQLLSQVGTLGVTLSEFIALGDWRTFFYARDAVAKVTPEDVQRVAQQYLKESNRTVGIFYPTATPDRATMPTAPNVADVLKGYTGRAAVVAGEALDPDPLKLEPRVKRPSSSDLLQIVTLPYKTRGEKVQLSINLDFGDLQSLEGRSAAAGFVGAMLQLGSEGLSRQQLADQLAQLKSELSVSSSATGANISLSSDRKNLDAALKLLQTVLRKPLFLESELAQLKRETLADLEYGKSEPRNIAQNALSRHLMPKGLKPIDPRYVETIDEEIASTKAVTLEEVKNVYRDFWGANSLQIGAVGDFDEATLRSSLSSFLDGWKAAKPYTRIPSPATLPALVNTVIDVPDKANATLYGVLNFAMRDNHPDYPALVVANYIFGGGALSSRLADRLRQKDGLSYGVGSSLGASALDDNTTINFLAIFAPQNAEKVEAGLREELDKARKEGFTAAELTAAKTGILETRRLSRTNDAGLAGTLAAQLKLGRTFQFSNDFEAKIRALTLEQVNAAMVKYFDPAQLSLFRAGTFKK